MHSLFFGSLYSQLSLKISPSTGYIKSFMIPPFIGYTKYTMSITIQYAFLQPQHILFNILSVMSQIVIELLFINSVMKDKN